MGPSFRNLTGGPYLYAHAAFGPATGFLVGWLSWISRLFSFATIANLAITGVAICLWLMLGSSLREFNAVAVLALAGALVFVTHGWARQRSVA